MKDFYQVCFCSVVIGAFAVSTALSADQSWQSKPGYFSDRGSVSGAPPDVIGVAAAERSVPQSVSTPVAAAGVWQTRELTNAAVIQPALLGGARTLVRQVPPVQPILEQRNDFRMPAFNVGNLIRFGLF